LFVTVKLETRLKGSTMNHVHVFVGAFSSRDDACEYSEAAFVADLHQSTDRDLSAPRITTYHAADLRLSRDSQG